MIDLFYSSEFSELCILVVVCAVLKRLSNIVLISYYGLWILTDEEEKSSKTTKSVNIHGYCYVFQKEGGFRGDFFILSLN